jgi:tetratricopeptide (TPR) repeat protein
MIFRWLLLSLAVAALAPGLLRAQQSGQPGLPPGGGGSANPAASVEAKMYEDIEIFRRILDRKLHSLYPRSLHPSAGGMGGIAGFQGGIVGFQGGMAGMPGMPGMPPGTSFNTNTAWVEEVGNPVEGVYLKGQGVVYTATLSSLQPPRSSAKAETPKPVSEWDSVRREVHNEKEKPKEPAASKSPELSDLLLNALAENGHHFAQLGENESLTIVVTVHEKSLSTTATPKSGRQSPQSLSPQQKTVQKTIDQAKARDLELVGDLHMKQEHYGQARDAFREALALKPGRYQSVTLARKLAQAYLMLSNIEEARSALDQALALAKEDTDAKDKPAAKPAAALPIKLIASAPKKLLDQAGEKKISFEEFRRRASVETLTFGERRR